MKPKTRLYLKIPIKEKQEIILEIDSSHYLTNILRLKENDVISVFNGIDGEYEARILEAHKKKTKLLINKRSKSLLKSADFTLLFAIIKKSPLEYLVQKSTEIGVGVFQPLITDYTVVREINLERLEKVVIEAAEQCGLTSIPIFKKPLSLKEAMENYKNIVFCDETMTSPALVSYKNFSYIKGALIGPEGGFSSQERENLKQSSNFTPVGLGNRILRAETAAVTASSIIILQQENNLENLG